MRYLILFFMVFNLSWAQEQQQQQSRSSSNKAGVWYFGVKYNDFDYSEPGLMSETGNLAGVEVAYNYKPSGTLIRHLFELEYFQGELHYDGSYWDGTPAEAETEDKLFAGRWTFTQLLFGHFEPYLGLAFRMWRNKISDSGGYRREIDYAYVPIGFRFSFGQELRFVAQAEYDFFLSGSVTSHLEDTQPDLLYPAENTQKKGKGYRLQVGLEWKLFYLKLDYRFWEIEDSDQVYYGGVYVYEPHNKTKSYGITLGLKI